MASTDPLLAPTAPVRHIPCPVIATIDTENVGHDPIWHIMCPLDGSYDTSCHIINPLGAPDEASCHFIDAVDPPVGTLDEPYDPSCHISDPFNAPNDPACHIAMSQIQANHSHHPLNVVYTGCNDPGRTNIAWQYQNIASIDSLLHKLRLRSFRVLARNSFRK